MSKEERDALQLINKIRRYEGRPSLKRMPKGDIGELYSCPIARALNHGRIGVSNDTIDVPKRAKKKIAALRRARLPIVKDEDADFVKAVDSKVFFKTPASFAKFIRWFDYQLTEDAAQLIR